MRFFRCSWPSCDKEFVRKADLARHFQIHVDERPYACPEQGCSRRFHQRSSLSIHQRIHTGERPYLCEFEGCQRAFSDPSSYSRHQRSHKHEKPFVCGLSYCRQRFSCKASLEHHRLQHEEHDIASEQQHCRLPVATEQSTFDNIAVTAPPARPPPRFQNGDNFDWGAIPCDNMNIILGRLAQSPSPNVVPFPTTPEQSRAPCYDQHFVNLSGLGDLPVQQPVTQWSFPPTTPAPNRCFNLYTDDNHFAYNDNEQFPYWDSVT